MAQPDSESSLSETHTYLSNLLNSTTTISSACAQDPALSPGEHATHLFRSHHIKPVTTNHPPSPKHTYTASELAWARSCGNFGDTKPSELFLRAYYDLLQCLLPDPLANCVSPSLIGTTGRIPLSIIAPLNDQLRHMSNLIVRAKKEVCLATNFWKASGATTFVTDALLELSRRAGERGERVVVKLMFDRGDLMQVFGNHQDVDEKGWTAEGVGIPKRAEIPNLDLAVVNFHRPPLGTFHCKFMVVDRQIATVSSNNIQDNDNLEMMTHLEGAIVDSLYDCFLFSWNNALEPLLPCRDSPAAERTAPTYNEETFSHLFDDEGSFRIPALAPGEELPEHMPHDPHHDTDIYSEIKRMHSVLTSTAPTTAHEAIASHLNKPTGLNLAPTVPASHTARFFPFVPLASHTPVPMALCNRKPHAPPTNSSVFVPQNETFLSLIRNARKEIFIQTPDLNAKPLLPALIEACERGVEVTYYVCLGYNDAGEMLPGQGGTNEQNANHLLTSLSSEAAREKLKIFFYVAADQSRPVHNSFKQRSCHIKLLIVDSEVAVQGSGNQDTQSWFHSQEVNVMVDSKEVCRVWREAIERNQNTAEYGRVSGDGCWYEEDGTLAKGSFGLSQGMFGWAKGAVGILKKAQGK